MRYLRMIWRFMTLDDRPMDEQWRPLTPIVNDRTTQPKDR